MARGKGGVHRYARKSKPGRGHDRVGHEMHGRRK